jgi:hypothetical protein
LAHTVAVLSIERDSVDHNILDSIRKENGGKIFYKFISIIIVLTFLVIIPFEIYVSSSLFASVLPESQYEDMLVVFAVVLFTLM